MGYFLAIALLFLGNGIIPSSSQSCTTEIEAFVEMLDASCYDNFRHSLEMLLTDSEETIREFCRIFDSTVRSCVVNATSGCTSSATANLDDWISENRGRICEQGSTNVASHTEKYIGYLRNVDDNELLTAFNVFDAKLQDSADCADVKVDIYLDFIGLDTYSRYYTEFMRCLRVELSFLSYEDELKYLYMYYFYLRLPMGVIVDPDIIHKDFKLVPRDQKRATVTVFGDPHLRVYGRGYMTCGSKGETGYLRNKYVTITGQNTEAFAGSAATYMTRVSIGFHDSNGDTKTFTAGNSKLDTQFGDGESTIYSGTDDEVSMKVISDNMVRFVYGKSGTSIVLARFRHTYMMVVRAAENVLEASSGLLVQGCADQIDTDKRRRRKRAAACDGVDDEYKPYCDYDFDVTGDEELASSVNTVKEAEEATVEVDEELFDSGSSGLNAMSTMLMLIICFILFELK